MVCLFVWHAIYDTKNSETSSLFSVENKELLASNKALLNKKYYTVYNELAILY
jgi:hypothetical protein